METIGIDESINKMANLQINNMSYRNQAKNMGNSSDKNLGIFKILKLGKRRWTSNQRLLVVLENAIIYYNFPPKRRIPKFFEIFDKLYSPSNTRISNAKLEEEERLFNELCREFFDNKDVFDTFKKEEIALDMCDIVYEVNEKDNPKKFENCVLIKKSSEKKNEPLIFEDFRKKNAGETKSSGDKNSKDINWVVSFYDQIYLDRFKKLIGEIKRIKKGAIDAHQQLNMQREGNNLKQQKKEEEIPIKEEKKKDENSKEIEADIIQITYTNEICFQLLLKQYYWISANMNNQAIKIKHELAILQMTTKFKEICQILVKRIVSDLYAKNIFSHNSSNSSWSYSLFPIVFPHPQKLKKPEQAVFLYYIGGVNFTLTWHQTIFKMRNEKMMIEEGKLNGAWNNLNVEFKNRDFFQDLMIKLSRDHKIKFEMPRYPISCLIDYCGFRVLCEADIYLDDGGSAVFKRNDLGLNMQMRDESYDFYKTLSQIFSSDKSQNAANMGLSMHNIANIKSDRDYAFQNPESLFYVSYQREIRQKQLSYFQSAINYHNKQFKDLDTYVFKNTDLLKIMMKGFVTEKRRNNQNSVIMSSMTGMYEGDTSLANKENPKGETSILNNSNYEMTLENKNTSMNNSNKIAEIFDLLTNPNYQSSQGIKDLKDMVYIMDLKLVKEIEEKAFEDSKKKTSSTNHQTINSNQKRSVYFRPEFLMKYLEEEVVNATIEKEVDNSDKFLKNLKKILQIEGDSGNPNYPNTNAARIYFKEHHINYFMNCLDTMHFKPYDSASLSEVFHQYGINMFYLGLVAESTSAPHIRELCMIEMIARECKKIIFDLIAFKLIERANEEYYINDQGKNYVEYDYINSTTDPYPLFVPVSFFLRYYRDYLKKIQILNTDMFKCTYTDEINKLNNAPSKGLYRLYWSKRNGYNDKDVRFFLHPKEEKSGKSSKDNNNEKFMLNEAHKEIVKFFNVLMNFEDRIEFSFLGEKYKNSTLWALINDRIKTHYNIENKEIFSYCEPQFISLPALLNSIQYHTGISLNIPLVNNTKFNNESLINREFFEDWILEIKPVTKVYSYRTFHINKNKYDTIINDHSITFDESFYQKTLLRYLTEKFQKSLSTFTWTNLLYSSLIYKMDYKSSDAVVNWIFKNDIDLKDKIKAENEYIDYFRNQFLSNTQKFESFLYLCLILIEPFSNYLRDDSHNNPISLNTSKNGGLSILADLNTAIEYIGEFWENRKHPFLCQIYILIARLYSKTKSNTADDKIENYYESALNIARDALGYNNVHVANLCVEIGIFYVKNKNYYEGTKHLLISHNVFKSLKEEFFECYIKILKKITKYFIILGYYKEALEHGSELVENYLSYMKIMSNQLTALVDIKIVLFNLILICRSMSKYEKGLEFCKNLIYDLNGSKPDLTFGITKFRDWRYIANPKKKNMTNPNFKLQNEQIEEDKYKKVNLFRIMKIYLQLIIKNLRDMDRLIYIQALVKLIENKKEKEYLESLPNDPDNLFESFYLQIKDEGELTRIFAKILYHIGPKYEQEKILDSVNELDKNQKESWRKFRFLYKIFSRHKVFTSLIDTEIYSNNYGK